MPNFFMLILAKAYMHQEFFSCTFNSLSSPLLKIFLFKGNVCVSIGSMGSDLYATVL